MRHKHTPGSHGACCLECSRASTGPTLHSGTPRHTQSLSGLPSSCKGDLYMPQQGGRHSEDVRAVFPGPGAAEKCVVLQCFNSVDIHKINLLSEEINPMPCSHGNTSHAAQFQSWDFMGSHPSWSSCFPGHSLRAQEWGSGRGGEWEQLELRNASLESELLRNHFSHPAPVRLLLGFPGELWEETLDPDEVTLACRSWQAQPRPRVPPTRRPAKSCVLPNTEPRPSRGFVPSQGFFAQGSSPQGNRGRKVTQQGVSSDSSRDPHRPICDFHLCVLGAWLPPVGVTTGGTPSSWPVC